MSPETRAAIADAWSAGSEILEICAGDPTVYGRSRPESLAIERLFLNLGESMLRVRQHSPYVMHRIPASREVIGFRNVLVHGYDQIDPARVNVVIDRWLPALLAEPSGSPATGVIAVARAWIRRA